MEENVCGWLGGRKATSRLLTLIKTQLQSYKEYSCHQNTLLVIYIQILQFIGVYVTYCYLYLFIICKFIFLMVVQRLR